MWGVVGTDGFGPRVSRPSVAPGVSRRAIQAAGVSRKAWRTRTAMQANCSGLVLMATAFRRCQTADALPASHRSRGNQRMNSVRYAALTAVISIMMFAGNPAVAQTVDHPPVDLPDAQKMVPTGGETWSYNDPSANFLKYRSVIVDPGEVYIGPDAQFDGVDLADRTKYAGIMTSELQAELAKSFPAPAKIGPDTLRVHLDLIGVQKTEGGLATATRVTPIGLGLSALKSIRGKQGTFTGSVLYAVSAYDAKTGKLLLVAVRRRTPDPLDIPATLSTTDTVKAVARDFAITARKALENMTQVQPGQ